eukprot:m.167678 g.167678  ORF g.167678 m.167678 type:complete len:642 (+) comp53179_c0_seq3:22-1947(+)
MSGRSMEMCAGLPGTVVGVRPIQQSLLLAIDTIGFRLIDSSDQTCNASWSLPAGRTAACAALHASASIFAIITHPLEVYAWDLSCTDLTAARHAPLGKVSSSVQSIYLTKQEDALIVIFKNGDVMTVDTRTLKVINSNSVFQRHDSADSKKLATRFNVIDSHYSSETDRVHLLAASTSEFQWAEVSVGRQSAERVEQCGAALPSGTSFAASSVAIISSNSSALLIIGTGQLYKVDVSSGAMLISSVPSFDAITFAKHKGCVSMCSYDKDHVLFTGVSAKDSSQLVVIVFDIVYNIVQSTFVVQHDFTASSGTMHMTRLTDETVAVYWAGNCYLVGVEVGASTLASALGRSTVPPKPALTHAFQFDKDWSFSARGKEKEVDRLTAALINSSKLTETEFSEAYHALIKASTLGSVRLSPQLADKILDVVLAEKRYFARAVVSSLLTCEAVSPTHASALLAVIVAQRDELLLQHFFVHVLILPSAALVKNLQAVLAVATDESGKTFAKLYIHLMMASRIDETDLVSHLKLLQLHEAKFLLEDMSELMTDFQYGTPSVSVASTKLTFSQVVDWISYLFDAHFSALILSPEMHPLLLQIRKQSSQFTDMCEEIRDFQGLLGQIKARKRIPDTAGTVGDYSIEYCVF